MLYDEYMSVGFRTHSEEDLRGIEANRREDEKTSDVIRRALGLLDREAWGKDRGPVLTCTGRGEDLIPRGGHAWGGMHVTAACIAGHQPQRSSTPGEQR